MEPSTSSATEVRRQRELQAAEDARFTKKLLIVGVCVGMLLLLGSAIYFATRDTWERDNAAGLIALKTEAEKAKNAKPETAIAKCEEILAVLQDRKLVRKDLIDVRLFAVKTLKEMELVIAEIEKRRTEEKAADDRRKGERAARQIELENAAKREEALRLKEVEEQNKRAELAKRPKGKLTVEVTYLFNNFVGNKPDTDAIVLLIPKDYTKKIPIKLGLDTTILVEGGDMEKDGLQHAKVSGSGKAKFNKIAAGKYTCVIQSNRTNNYGMDGMISATAGMLGKYFTGDLKQVGTHKRYHIQDVEIEENDETEISHDFGVTGI